MTTDTLKALRAYAASIGTKSEKGMTTDEIRQALGIVSVNTARARMKDMIKAKTLRHAGFRATESISGAKIRVPVYEVVK